jgi:hypothetical protein
MKRIGNLMAEVDLYAGYVVTGVGLGLQEISVWVHGKPWDHWFVIGSGVVIAAALPWTLLAHRREVRKYGTS